MPFGSIRRQLLATISLQFCISAHCFAASFDCALASTNVERLVCTSPTLSRLDDSLASAYLLALRSSSEPRRTQEAQQEWLQGKRGACVDTDCLEAEYKSRIALLNQASPILIKEEVSTGPSRLIFCDLPDLSAVRRQICQSEELSILYEELINKRDAATEAIIALDGGKAYIGRFRREIEEFEENAGNACPAAEVACIGNAYRAKYEFIDMEVNRISKEINQISAETAFRNVAAGNTATAEAVRIVEQKIDNTKNSRWENYEIIALSILLAALASLSTYLVMSRRSQRSRIEVIDMERPSKTSLATPRVADQIAPTPEAPAAITPAGKSEAPSNATPNLVKATTLTLRLIFPALCFGLAYSIITNESSSNKLPLTPIASSDGERTEPAVQEVAVRKPHFSSITPTTGKAATSQIDWQEGIEYKHHRNISCTSDQTTRCLSLDEYKAACNDVSGATLQAVKTAALSSDSAELQTLAWNGETQYSFSNWGTANAGFQACYGHIVYRGIVRGNSINRTEESIIISFLFKDGQLLAHAMSIP